MQIFSFPGDVDSPTYPELCPNPIPVQVTVMGLVGGNHQPHQPSTTLLRSFELKASVWDAMQHSVAFTLICLFPHSRCWENTQIPARGALVCVTGEVVGEDERTGHLAVLVQSFDYISTWDTEPATQSSSGETGGGEGPSTPKRARWEAWAGKSSSPQKLTHQGNGKVNERTLPASSSSFIDIDSPETLSITGDPQ